LATTWGAVLSGVGCGISPLIELRLYWRARRPLSPADDARIETWLAQLEDLQAN